MINIKTEKEIEKMRAVGKIVRDALDAVAAAVKPGVSTLYLDEVAMKVIKENNAHASCIGVPCPYRGGKAYRHALCVSVNDEIIHGIPSKDKILKEGDIVCIDLVVNKDGFHGDAGRTVGCGKITPENQRLIDVTKRAFFEAIKYAKPGYRIGDISHAVEDYVMSNGYTLLEEYQGHGIGREMHEDPGVPNMGKKGTGPRLTKGMAIAIEPMVCSGSNKVYVKNDKWTIATVDRKMTAYYENTIIITENEPEILTF